jgi:hypothetical protein
MAGYTTSSRLVSALVQRHVARVKLQRMGKIIEISSFRCGDRQRVEVMPREPGETKVEPCNNGCVRHSPLYFVSKKT